MGKLSLKAVRAMLADISSGSNTYSWAYENAMGRIESQHTEQAKFAKQVLAWVTYAKRPLTLTEIQHALAIEIGSSFLDEENIPQLDDLISVCAGLITIDERRGVIRLVHSTAQEYFDLTGAKWFPGAEAHIASACLTYLSFDEFATGFCHTDLEFEDRLWTYRLYDYAAEHWGDHAADIPVSNPELTKFINRQASLEAASQALFVSEKFWLQTNYSQLVPTKMTALHLTAHFGLLDASVLLLRKHHPDTMDSYRRTPLVYAASNGREAVAKALLQRKASVRVADLYGDVPLSYAAGKGHDGIVKLLLDKDSSTDLGNIHKRQAILYAVKFGNSSTTKLLLEHGADVNSYNSFSQTVLAIAATHGHNSTIENLLNWGASMEATDLQGRTPLLCAAASGYDGTVALLVQRGAKIGSRDSQGRNVVSHAAENGDLSTIKYLHSQKAEIDQEDSLGRTPLSYAARKGHKIIAAYLLENGVREDHQDTRGRTPLFHAAEGNKISVVGLLINAGADIHSRSRDVNEIVSRSNGMNLRGSTASASSTSGRTPLFAAVMNGHDKVVKILLERGAKVEAWPSLQCVNLAAYEGMVELLNEYGARVHWENIKGVRFLNFAIKN